jgi:ribonuclease BN (tRNA processing enzyme)
MPRVTFLGVGAALPAPGQTNCAFLIDLPGACLLFDCGPAILQQLAAVGRRVDEVTHVFVSHGHGDHALGWPMLMLSWKLGKGKPPCVIASQRTWEHLRGLWSHSYTDLPEAVIEAVGLPTDRPGKHKLLGGVSMATWPMIHSESFPVLGMRLKVGRKALAFTADTARCDSIAELAKGAHLLVQDARHAATVMPVMPIQSTWHTSARDAGEYAAAAGARRLALVHIGAEYLGREAELVAEAKGVFAGEVLAPKAGDVVEV